MAYDEFIALDRGLLRHRSKAISRRCRKATPGADASAIHGRLGARVALLQSPILPVVSLSYYKNRNFQTNPVDKPHTRHPWLFFAFSPWTRATFSIPLPPPRNPSPPATAR